MLGGQTENTFLLHGNWKDGRVLVNTELQQRLSYTVTDKVSFENVIWLFTQFFRQNECNAFFPLPPSIFLVMQSDNL